MFEVLLAYSHHFFAFALISILAAELVLLSNRTENIDVVLLARLDLTYGLSAVLLLLAGTARLVWGEKGWDFFSTNPVFWMKMVLFSIAALLSISPTIAFRKWVRQIKADPIFKPEIANIIKTKTAIRFQLIVLALVPLLAAMMARGIGV